MIQEFMDEFNCRNNLLHLLPNQPMLIQIQTESSSCYLSLGKSIVEVKDTCDQAQMINIYMTGSEEQIEKVLKGELRLQQAMKLNEIKVKGTFRSILLLESICILCRPYHQRIQKVI